MPDSILDLAEEVEVVDLPAADLVERVKRAKVDTSAHPGSAIHGFFLERNLSGLRSLAIQRAKKPPARRILVPFDGSSSAMQSSMSSLSPEPAIVALSCC